LDLAGATDARQIKDMSLRFRCLAAIALCGAFLALLAGPASSPAMAEPGSWVDAPKKIPRPQRGERTGNLDFLFGALKVAPDEASAKSVEERIWAIWFVSKSDTANLLMTRVKAAMDAEDLDLAITLLDSIIQLKPDYTEAWNRRATAYYMKKNYERSLADIRQVLAREPRHFGALAGLGLIMQDLGDDKRALEVYRKALAIHPRLPKIPDLIKTLTEKVEGRDI
jgi:tetratricopeptide (TPR) repeat protein